MFYIYKLTCDASDEVYIGSTSSPLRFRLAKHKNDFKRYKDGKRQGYLSSFKLFEQGEVSIELIEELPECDISREGWHIKNTPNCINARIAGRTNKQYVLDNKEKRAAYVAKWHKDHPEKVKANRQKYYEKMSVKEKCECGMLFKIINKKRHLESKGHKDLMAGIPKETPAERKAKYAAARRVRVSCPQCQKEMSKAALTRHIKTIHA